MNAKTKIHQAHLNEWAILIQNQATSGLTVRDWCAKNNLTIHKYNYWKRLLKEELVDQVLPDIVPLSLTDSSPAPINTLCESRNSHDLYNSCNKHSHIENHYPIAVTINNVRIELHSKDIALLPDIIKAVRYA